MRKAKTKKKLPLSLITVSFLQRSRTHKGYAEKERKKKRHSGSRKRNFSQLGMFLIQSKAAALNKMLTQQIHKKKNRKSARVTARICVCAL